MRLKKITLDNFIVFEGKKEFVIGEMNFIKGKNGSGKTTLSLHSLLFALYGYSQKKLEDIPNKKGSKTALVSLIIEKDGEDYIITREYPTSLKIAKNGLEIDLANNQEKQRYINEIFGDLQYFKKFRTIDKDEGINVIDEGAIALKKTLFSLYEDLFNSVKDRLLDVKNDRELFNKERLQVDSHYPSDRRLKILTKNLEEINNKLPVINEVIVDILNQKNIFINEKGMLANESSNLNENLNKLETSSICPYCLRSLDQPLMNEKIDETIKKLTKIDQKAQNVMDRLEKLNILLVTKQKEFYDLYAIKDRLTKLIFKLSNRIKQKDFKYTSKDVVIVKQALVELDSFTSFFIVKSLIALEPIINLVLHKINYKIEFIVNDKNDISYNLYKDNQKYSKKDLSTGEKLILQIAFKLAILLQRGESGLIIADEGMANLDRDNLLHVIDLVKGFSFQLLFVIHNCEELPHYVYTINLGEK